MGVIGPLRFAVAFVLAAAAAAALAGVVSREAALVRPAFFVALAHAFLFGAPAYFVLRSRGRVTWLRCIGAGFVIGGVPLGLWLLSLGVVFLLGSHGAVAGLVFWPSLRLFGGGRDRAAPCRPTPPSLPSGSAFSGIARAMPYDPALSGRIAPRWIAPAAGDGDAGPVSRGSVLRAVCGVPVAVAAVAGVLAVAPERVVDQTCHNPLRNGRSVTPELRAHLRVDLDEWPRIVAAFEEFARARDWSLRRVPADEQRPLSHHLSICDPAGTQIVAWYLPIPDEPRRDERRWGVHVIVYQPQGGASWRAPTRDLLVDLGRRWPGRMGFTDDMGRVTDPPDLLAPGGFQPDTVR